MHSGAAALPCRQPCDPHCKAEHPHPHLHPVQSSLQTDPPPPPKCIPLPSSPGNNYQDKKDLFILISWPGNFPGWHDALTTSPQTRTIMHHPNCGGDDCAGSVDLGLTRYSSEAPIFKLREQEPSLQNVVYAYTSPGTAVVCVAHNVLRTWRSIIMPLTIPAAAGQNTRRLDVMAMYKNKAIFTMMSLGFNGQRGLCAFSID